MGRRPRQLSGGQRQRVAIGRAIVREPQVFLFDEPLSNLDAELRVQMRVEIARLHAELGVTMIYVTHDQVEAMTLADRIVVLRDGRHRADRPAARSLRRPGQPVRRRLRRLAEDELHGREVVAREDAAMTVALVNQGGARLTLPARAGVGAGDRLVVGVRPEHFVAAGQGDCDLTVAVDVTEHLGSTSYVYANTKIGEQLIVERASRAAEIGRDRLTVSIPARRAYAFDAAGVRLK